MILLNIENRVATLTLNRPEKRNALDDAMAAAILEQLHILKDDDSCKVLIIEGSGEAFCAGADLGYLQKLQSNSYEDNLQDSRALMRMFKALYEFPKISISKVKGPAFAGGCGLAGLCDFTFATEAARFAYTEVKIGFIPAIVSVFLASRIGENAARRMLLTGEVLNATQAKEIGLVYQVLDAAHIDETVMNFALGLSSGVSSGAVRLTKELLQQLPGLSLSEKLDLAAEFNAAARGTADCKAGIAAFLNKEKISW